MIKLKEGQKVIDIHGNTYLIEKGDILRESVEDVYYKVLKILNKIRTIDTAYGEIKLSDKEKERFLKKYVFYKDGSLQPKAKEQLQLFLDKPSILKTYLTQDIQAQISTDEYDRRS